MPISIADPRGTGTFTADIVQRRVRAEGVLRDKLRRDGEGTAPLLSNERDAIVRALRRLQTAQQAAEVEAAIMAALTFQ